MANTKTTAAKKPAATKKPTPIRKSTTPKKKISANDIRIRAQQIYEHRLHIGQQGDELSDWLSAEKELQDT